MSFALPNMSPLVVAQTNLYRYGGPIIICLGTISCVISLLVFTGKHLRKNVCSIYLTAVNLTNLLFIYTLVLFLVLPTGFNQPDLGASNDVACRFIFYTTHTVDSLNSWYIILASMDRVLITSTNPNIRRFSSAKVAWISLAIVSIFWLIFHIHTFIFTGIIQPFPGVTVCAGQTSGYSAFVSYYFLLVKGMIVPLLMAIFGIWTMKNIRSIRQRCVVPMSTVTASVTGPGKGTDNGSMNSKDRQFALMLAINLTIYVIFNLPLSIGTFYLQFQSWDMINMYIVQQNNFIRLVTLFSSFVPHCLDFYENLIISKSFRQEVMRLFKF